MRSFMSTRADDAATCGGGRRAGLPVAGHGAAVHFNPSTGATVAFHFFEQSGLDLSQTSAQTGRTTLLTALRISSPSAGVTGTLTSLNFLPVVHGSLPALQFSASWNSSSEYVQSSFVKDVEGSLQLDLLVGLELVPGLERDARSR